MLLTDLPPRFLARRFLLACFPYGIIYEHARQEIVVHAVAHLSRDPSCWVGR